MKILNDRGVGLLESIIGLGLIGLLAMGYTELHSRDLDATLRNRIVATRARVIATMTKAAAMKAVLRSSIQPPSVTKAAGIDSGARNDLLSTCIQGQLACPVTAPEDVILFWPETGISASGAEFTSGQMTGTKNKPLFLDANAVAVPGATAGDPIKAPFAIYTKFSVICHPTDGANAAFTPNDLLPQPGGCSANAPLVPGGPTNPVAAIKVYLYIDYYQSATPPPASTPTTLYVDNFWIFGE
jgi:hypothetical protein